MLDAQNRPIVIKLENGTEMGLVYGNSGRLEKGISLDQGIEVDLKYDRRHPSQAHPIGSSSNIYSSDSSHEKSKSLFDDDTNLNYDECMIDGQCQSVPDLYWNSPPGWWYIAPNPVPRPDCLRVCDRTCEQEARAFQALCIIGTGFGGGPIYGAVCLIAVGVGNDACKSKCDSRCQ